MSTIEALQAAIEKEKNETRAKFQNLKTEIEGLKEQIAYGTVVTPEQLDALIAEIDGISETDQDEDPAPEPDEPEQPAE